MKNYFLKVLERKTNMVYERMVLRYLRSNFKQVIQLLVILIVLAFCFRSNSPKETFPDSPEQVNRLKAKFATRSLFIQQPFDSESVKVQTDLYREDDYLMPISSDRLNKLFGILKEKELIYRDLLNQLGILSFNDLLDTNHIGPEYKDYIQLRNNNVLATDHFVNYLKAKSHIQTERNNLNRDLSIHRELAKVLIEE